MALLRQLSLNSLLTCGALVIAGAGTAYSLLQWANKDIRFAAAEIAGVEFLRPAVNLLTLLPEHARLSQTGDEVGRQTVAREIDERFSILLAHAEREREIFRLTPHALVQAGHSAADPVKLAEQWRRLAAAPSATNALPTHGYLELLLGTQQLVAHVGDTSNLILDPDIDTYYTMDIVLLSLPDQLQRLSRMPPWNLVDQSNPGLAPPAVSAALIREIDLARITKAVATIQADDLRTQVSAHPSKRDHDAALQAYTETTTRLLEALTQHETYTETASLAYQAQASAGQLWQSSAQQLTERLQRRIEHLDRRRSLSLTVGALGLLLCGAIVAKVLLQESRLWRQTTDLARTRRQQEMEYAQRHVAEQRTHLILDTSIDGLIIMNAAGTIIEWNTQAEQIFGWSRHEAIGRLLSDTITPPAHRAAHEAGIKTFLATGKGSILGMRIEVSALRRDQTEFPVEVTVNPLRVNDTWEFSAFVRDISERKQAEADILAAKEAAEKAAAELEEAHGRVQNALDAAMQLAEEAQAASKAKSEFLAVMSHELRTPMNGVLGMNELLLNSPLTDTQRKWAMMLHSSGQNLLAVINDVLDFSKIEAGKMQLEAAGFSPAKVIQDVIDCLAESARQKNIELIFDCAASVPSCLLGDATRFRQILFNLVGNALKFTSRGGIVINMAWQPTPSDQAYIPSQPDLNGTGQLNQLCVRVTDSGIGIPPEKIAGLFQSFSQADSSTTRKFGGTGLGLAICKRLVEIMGGRIGVESAVGHGSTFWFYLPLPVSNSCSFVPTHQVAYVTTAPFYPQRHPVLLVDDNEINLILGQELLQELGCEVTIAMDGQAAIARLENSHFELVLMDCRMPVLDGYATTRLIRQREAASDGNPHLPIIALTANAVEGDREKCLAAGMDDYLSKPVQRNELTRAIKRWLPAAAELKSV